MADPPPRCCIYTILYGPDRDLAARSLWSYRRQAPAASIVAVCIDGATPTLERMAARDGIQLIDLPESRFSVSRFGNTHLTAILGRFVDVPPLLPPADLYLLIDADTLCLRPPALVDLLQRMTECRATFAAAPEVSPAVGHKYLRHCRRIVDAFYLTRVPIDPEAIMVNAGVVAWRRAGTGVDFLEEFAACLQTIEDAGEALFLLPCVDQVILNSLAQRHAGAGFLLLDSAWNERHALVRSRIVPDWPAIAMREDAIIWHCRDSFEALWEARYSSSVDGRRVAQTAGDPAVRPGSSIR
jgi:hypothetical protein